MKESLGYEFKVTDVEGRTIVLTHPDYELDYPNLIELFIEFSIACGFDKNTIKKCLDATEVS